MTLKGIQKSMARAPQNFKQKFNIGDISEDPIYEDAERRFRHLEKETERLHVESKRCFDSINSMLSHQIQYAAACEELYKPISGRPSDPGSRKTEGNPDGIVACERYREIVDDLKESISPELGMIESRIIQPAKELLEVIKTVRKTIEKRNRKKLDYDRHRATYKKLDEKKDRTLKEEKAYMRSEQEVELATEDFQHFNELLTTELPQLFKLERDMIQPLFESFYYMQLNVFYTMHIKMQEMADINYFDLEADIDECFKERQGDVKQQAESLGIVHFKTVGGLRKGTAKGKEAKENATRTSSEENAPPPYTEKAANGAQSSSNWAGIAAQKKKPAPPPPKKPKALQLPKVETVTALYDYTAQSDDDLSFTAGQQIEVVHRTENTEEWWRGKVGGVVGLFPGNYVSLDR